MKIRRAKEAPAPQLQRALSPNESEVEEHAGVRVGQRVRLKPRVVEKYRAAGIGEGYVVRLSRPATVRRSVVNAARFWNSVELVREGEEHDTQWAAAEELEPAS